MDTWANGQRCIEYRLIDSRFGETLVKEQYIFTLSLSLARSPRVCRSLCVVITNSVSQVNKHSSGIIDFGSTVECFELMPLLK